MYQHMSECTRILGSVQYNSSHVSTNVTICQNSPLNSHHLIFLIYVIQISIIT